MKMKTMLLLMAPQCIPDVPKARNMFVLTQEMRFVINNSSKISDKTDYLFFQCVAPQLVMLVLSMVMSPVLELIPGLWVYNLVTSYTVEVPSYLIDLSSLLHIVSRGKTQHFDHLV